MPRVKNSVVTRKRRKKILKLAKGFGAKSNYSGSPISRY